MRLRKKEEKISETRASCLTGEMLVSGGMEGEEEGNSLEVMKVSKKRCYMDEGANFSTAQIMIANRW